jgi:hyperosmotically inducible protein
MNKPHALLLAAAASFAVLGLAACDRGPDRSPIASPPSTLPSTPPPTTRAPETAPAAPVADRTAGQTLDDAGITAKVKTALAAEKDVSAMAINVDTMQGKVTLTGKVSNQTEADRAVQIARGIEGVKSVDSKLTVGT